MARSGISSGASNKQKITRHGEKRAKHQYQHGWRIEAKSGGMLMASKK